MESNFNRVIDALPGLVWTALPDGNADFVNRGWLEYTGLSFDEACGRGWLEAVHPDDRPALLSGWTEFIACGQPGELEARLRRFDGTYRWFLFRASPIPDASGEVVRWCGINSDIEDRRRAETVAREEGRRFLETVDGLPALITLMDATGRLEYANQFVLEYFGASLEELQGRPVGHSLHPDDRADIMAAWAKSIASGKSYDQVARQRRADGEYRWVHLRGFPIRDADGRITVWYLMQTDIDDRKWAEALLAGEKHLLEMVAQGLPLAEVLETLCRIVEAAAPGCLCSILSIDPDGRRFRHGAGPSLPAEYNEVLDGLVMDYKFGPCGMAANWKTQVIAADVESDARWRESPWPGMVLGHGLRSCWSTPILSGDDRVIGVFALYQHRPGSPTPRQQDLTRQFTHIASIAIERAQSDEALRRSEARKAAILDSALDCIITIDHEGRITEFNPAAERTFGYREPDVLGKPMGEVIVPPTLREPHRLGLERHIASGEARILGKRIEMTAMRADGSEFPVELTIARTPLEGSPNFTGFLRDISERKRADEKLRRSNSHLAYAQRLSLTGSFTWNAVTNENYWSEEMYRIFDYDLGEQISPLKVTSERIHPDDVASIQRLLEDASIGRSFEIDCRAIMKDGRLKHLHIIGHKEEDLETGPRFIGAIQDVTDYRRSEEAARRSEAFLAEGERLSQTGSFSWRVAQNEIVWSEQVYRMFGYESSTAITLELIGARMHPEDLHLLEDMVKRASQGVADFAYEYRLLLPGGSIRHLQLIAHGHRDREGLMEYIGAVQDVTERRIAEETLSRARSELAHIARVSSLGALTASIAHEVNQPLAGIIANASTCLKMLAADPPNVAGAEETARRTLRDGNRAADVIRRLRALVTKRDAVREPVDLSEAAREVVALSSGDLQRNRITLKVALADPLPPVTGDRVQLQQVILNLMLNAADAMDGVDDRPRQILITTERDGDRVRLAVRDSGTGLAPDVADRLFEAFYTTKTNGMGIGLSISRSIVENHGGRLWAEPNTGPGATFCFSVPCGVDCAAGAADLRADGQSAAAVPQPTTVKD